MKKANDPYGYSVSDGKIVVEYTERNVICRIYSEYLTGVSPARIAAALNAVGIPYKNARCWNKNTVYRVLDDARYRGTDVYPPILCAETWNAAAAKRKKNSCPYMDAEFLVIRKKMACAECEGKLTRNWKRNKGIWWECPTCGIHTGTIEDAAIFYQVVAKLDTICQNHNLIQCPRQNEPIVLECVRLEREFKRMVSDPTARLTELDDLAKIIAQMKFRNIDPQGYIFATEQIKLALEPFQPGRYTGNEREALFKQIVSQVLLDKNGAIQLKLKNGQIL